MWFFEGSHLLPEDLVEDLTDPQHEVYLSDVSLLELVIKHQLRKLDLPKPPSRFVLPLARKHGIDLWPLDTATIFGLEALPLLHRDPFDRLLVSQARVHRLTLVTPDRQIQRYDVAWRW